MATVSAREFNRDVSAAKRAARQEPVFIADQGVPSHVLLSIEEFRRLTHSGQSIVDRLMMDDDIDFDPEPLHIGLRIPDL